jgi:hypothetical protein
MKKRTIGRFLPILAALVTLALLRVAQNLSPPSVDVRGDRERAAAVASLYYIDGTPSVDGLYLSMPTDAAMERLEELKERLNEGRKRSAHYRIIRDFRIEQALLTEDVGEGALFVLLFGENGLKGLLVSSAHIGAPLALSSDIEIAELVRERFGFELRELSPPYAQGGQNMTYVYEHAAGGAPLWRMGILHGETPFGNRERLLAFFAPD